MIVPAHWVFSLPLENRYPRGFSVYPTASQPAVFALEGYPVYFADSQSARFSLGVPCVKTIATFSKPEEAHLFRTRLGAALAVPEFLIEIEATAVLD